MLRSLSRGQVVAIAATLLGTTLLLVSGYLAFFKDSAEPLTAAQQRPNAQQLDVGEDEIPKSFEDLLNPDKPGDGSGSSTSLTGEDPFKGTFDNKRFYDVTITVRSDGPVFIGYRFRSGTEGPYVADRSKTITKRLRGPLPVAQVGVQVFSSSTYATCTIKIDGVTIAQGTAKGTNDVVVCTA